MIYSIYDPASGIIISRANDADQIMGRSYVEGDYTPGQYQVIKGQVLPMPQPPAQPVQAVWLWHPNSQTYTIDIARTNTKARRIRQDLLTAVDQVNPMWWSAMTPDQQTEISAYRQALLDITDQPGYPATINWPAKPAWL